jgi:hypothetical protein
MAQACVRLHIHREGVLLGPSRRVNNPEGQVAEGTLAPAGDAGAHADSIGLPVEWRACRCGWSSFSTQLAVLATFLSLLRD